MEATKKRKLKPSDLLPPKSGSSGIEKQYWIWTGLTEDAPRTSLSLAGVSFPKLNGELQPDEAFDNTEVLRSVRGSLTRVTADGLRELKDTMSRTLFRFHGEEQEVGLEEEPGSGKRHRYRNHSIVKIPRESQVKEAKKHGNPVQAYHPHPNDVGVAKYCWVMFTDKRHPKVPPTCAEAGFYQMPEDLEL